MGYNDRNPSFTFRFGEYRHGKLNKLAKAAKMPTVDYVRIEILDKFLNGDLVPKSKDDLALEMQKLRLEKIKQEIRYLQIKNNFSEAFDKPMSATATRILKPQIITAEPQTQIYDNPQSPYDAKNKRLQCVDCGILFTWGSEHEFNDQIAEFQRHLVSKHNRVKTEIERQVLIELSYEGISAGVDKWKI
jgi:hypothetical protein